MFGFVVYVGSINVHLHSVTLWKERRSSLTVKDLSNIKCEISLLIIIELLVYVEK
jgi:hypothetical protein